MKKIVLAALMVASFGAHALTYECSHTAPNGFVEKDNQLSAVFRDDNSEVFYFGKGTYFFNNPAEVAKGVYSNSGDSTVSVTKNDADGYDLSVIYKDAETTKNYSCVIPPEQITLMKQEEAREQAEANKTPQQKKAEEKAAAEKAARAKKQAAEKAAAGAGVDDLLGDVTGGKNTPRQKQPISSGSSGVDISAYSAQIQMAIRNKIEGVDSYAGERCTLHIAMSSDGTIQSVQSEGGDEGLCNAAITGVRKAGSLPKPPSQAVYNIFKDFRIDFKP